MPARKRLAVALAVLAALSLAGAGVAGVAAGHLGPGLALSLGTLVLAAAALHALWPPFDLSGASLRRGDRRARRAALTFDDGPSDDTPAVLDALDAAGARATFFVLGAAAERRPALVREVARRGHEVALHGHSHRRLALAGPRTVAAEIDRGREAIRRAGVEPALLFRAPHGWKGPFLGAALRRRGLRLVAWTRGAWDTERPGPAAIAERATRRSRPGEIVLLHDGCGTDEIDPRRDQTAAAIPEIVRRLRAAGLELVTAGELAAATPPAHAGRRLRLAGLAGLAALCAWALARVDVRAVAAALAGAHPGLLALACAANLASLAAHAARWRAVVTAPVRVRYRDALPALVSGFAAGLVLPGRGGDLVRAHLLARRSGVPTATVVAASALDYVVGAATFVVAFGLLGVAAPLPGWGPKALAASAALAGAALVAAWLLRPPPGAYAPEGLAARLRAGLGALHDARALATSAAWGLAGWTAEWAIALATLAALDLPATPAVAALLVAAATAAAATGVTPGNAGTFELATALALGGTGVPAGGALAFALAFHAAHAVPVAILGGSLLLREGVARDGLARGK